MLPRMMLKSGPPALTWSAGVIGTCDCIVLLLWAFLCGFHHVECSLLEKLGVSWSLHLLKNHFSGENRLTAEAVKCKHISVT